MGLYNAEISAGSLMLPESRRIAKLLLTHPSVAQWDAALKDENLLQKKPATARRQARLIRNRLDTLDDAGLALVLEGDGELWRNTPQRKQSGVADGRMDASVQGTRSP